MYSMARSENSACSAMGQPYTAPDGTRSPLDGPLVSADQQRHACVAPRPIT